jgi:uncharacterized protein YprB with RNaseH-like and TPR domain
MISADKLKKLEDLAGKLAGANIFLGSQLEKKKKAPATIHKILSLEEAVPGEVKELVPGKYYHIRRNLKALWPQATEIVTLYKSVFCGTARRLDLQSAGRELTAVTAAPPHAVTYLDIETCGFSGTPIFLVGWCFFDGQNDLVVEQALARDYAEESGILAATADRLAQTEVLVTYNGKRFDVPTLRERAVIHRVKLPKTPVHLDMLYPARAHWKTDLPNCKLKTVELHLCRRPRHGDIDGADIPQAYHDFVKNLDARKLKTIIHHNFLDLVTLAEITARLLAGHEPGVG